MFITFSYKWSRPIEVVISPPVDSLARSRLPGGVPLRRPPRGGHLVLRGATFAAAAVLLRQQQNKEITREIRGNKENKQKIRKNNRK